MPLFRVDYSYDTPVFKYVEVEASDVEEASKVALELVSKQLDAGTYIDIDVIEEIKV